MNGSKGNRTPDASERSERGEVILSLSTVNKMLPLVKRIVEDIQASQRALGKLHPEESRLDRDKRKLDWPQRQRRYRLKEELASVETGLQGATEELQNLGVALLDAFMGKVGFPTMVNNRPAYFSWQSGESEINSWHFIDEDARRPIPATWLKEISVSSKKS